LARVKDKAYQTAVLCVTAKLAAMSELGSKRELPSSGLMSWEPLGHLVGSAWHIPTDCGLESHNFANLEFV
jgi:hypothetical protein